ncbi:MAG: hypothetical protein HY516_05160 [Candidatus Aenigmarchaeota archaeon]|nr:hypothetical protein [Candidatus Aenigmarchaeota archaeon]
MSKDDMEELTGEPLMEGVLIGSGLQSATGDYFGIGLSNRHGLTSELPFDVMVLVLGAEFVRRRLQMETVTTLIADEHAKTNGFSRSDIDAIAKTRREFLSRSLDRLGFENWDICLASEIAQDPYHKELLSVPIMANSYERMQLADMELFRSKGKSVKIGWKHDGMEFDERHFDEMYKSSFGNGTTFVYTPAGRSLDGTPLPPYLHVPNKPRLIMSKTENIHEKVGLMPKRVRAHFNRVADLFENLVYGPTQNKQNVNSTEYLEKRLREIYSVVFG